MQKLIQKGARSTLPRTRSKLMTTPLPTKMPKPTMISTNQTWDKPTNPTRQSTQGAKKFRLLFPFFSSLLTGKKSDRVTFGRGNVFPQVLHVAGFLPALYTIFHHRERTRSSTDSERVLMELP